MAAGQLAELRSPLRLGGTAVFMYHGLTGCGAAQAPWREQKYWVSAAQFHGHLDCLARAAGYVSLLGEAWDSAEASRGRNPRAVLTFDDGRSSDFEIAYPLLLDFGIRVEFFVNTGTIGSPGFLSWRQIADMQRAGMSFQSHGHDHVALPELPQREQERQLRVSKQILEDRLGTSVAFLAVPYGSLNQQVSEVALQEGYRAVCNSLSWPAQPGRRMVNRVPVYAHTTAGQFRRLLTGNPVSYAARGLRAALLYLPKRVLSRFSPPAHSAAPLENVT